MVKTQHQDFYQPILQLFYNTIMCYSVLTMCPTCKSNIRHFHPCSSGSTTSADFKYTSLTAEVCSASKSLISVRFSSGTCSDCIRYAKADSKAAAAAKANIEEWSRELDVLNERALHQQRVSTLRPPPTAHSEKSVQDSQGGRKALLRMWYDDAKTKKLRTLIRSE